MARPKIDEAKKRHSVSVSVRLDTLERSKESGNASRFFEQASDSMLAIGQLMASLASGHAKRADVLEDIEDIVDAWHRMGEAAEPVERVLADMKRVKKDVG